MCQEDFIASLTFINIWIIGFFNTVIIQSSIKN